MQDDLQVVLITCLVHFYFCINGLLNNNIIITSNSKKVYKKQTRKEVVET